MLKSIGRISGSNIMDTLVCVGVCLEEIFSAVGANNWALGVGSS